MYSRIDTNLVPTILATHHHDDIPSSSSIKDDNDDGDVSDSTSGLTLFNSNKIVLQNRMLCRSHKT